MVTTERQGATVWIRYQSDLQRLDGLGLLKLRQAVDAATTDPSVRVILFGGPPQSFPILMDPQEGLAIAALTPPLPAMVLNPFLKAIVAVLLRFPWLGGFLDWEGQARRNAYLNQRLMTDRLERCDKVTIAAIDGPAFGGGLEIALACDIRVASDKADVFLAQPEVVAGVMAGFGATQRLPRLLGESRALALLLTAEAITPEEARAIGLVHRVLPAETFEADVWAFGARLSRRSPESVEGTKRAVRGALPIGAGLGVELAWVLSVWSSGSARAGLARAAAFLDAEREITPARSLPAVLLDLEAAQLTQAPSTGHGP